MTVTPSLGPSYRSSICVILCRQDPVKLDRGSRELYENKDLMTGPKGNSEFCFPKTLNTEVEEVEVAPLPMIFHRKVYPSIPCACNEL